MYFNKMMEKKKPNKCVRQGKVGTMLDTLTGYGCHIFIGGNVQVTQSHYNTYMHNILSLTPSLNLNYVMKHSED